MVADSMISNESDLNSSLASKKHLNYRNRRLASLRLPKLTQTVVPTVFSYDGAVRGPRPRIELVDKGADRDVSSKLNVSDSVIYKSSHCSLSPKSPDLTGQDDDVEKEVPNRSFQGSFCLKTSSDGNSSPPYLKSSNVENKVIESMDESKLSKNTPVRVSKRFVVAAKLKLLASDVKVHTSSSSKGFNISRLCSADSSTSDVPCKTKNRKSESNQMNDNRREHEHGCEDGPMVDSNETQLRLKRSFPGLEDDGRSKIESCPGRTNSSKVSSYLHKDPDFPHPQQDTSSEGGSRNGSDKPNKWSSDEVERGFAPGTPLSPAFRKLPEGVELTLAELEEMACRQQHQIDTQRQLLAAKEQRLRFLKQHEARHQQVAVEHERLRRLRDRVEAQELKLKKLRALRGQVDHTKLNNASLTSDLKSIRALFNEKEKELSVAVAKVEELTLQLEELKKGRNAMPAPPSAAAAIELDKLRRELMYRNKLNEQQSARLTQQREALVLRQEEATAIDRRISELQDRLQRKRLLNQQLAEQINNSGNKQNDQLRNALSSSALQHHLHQHHQQNKYQEQMNSCPSVPAFRPALEQNNKQIHSDRIATVEPFLHVPSTKASDLENDFLKTINNNNNNSNINNNSNSSNNNNINNNNISSSSSSSCNSSNNNFIYQLSNTINQRKISQDDFLSLNKNILTEIPSTKLITNYNVNNSNQNRPTVNSISDHIVNNNLIIRSTLSNKDSKLSPNPNDRLSEFSVSKSDPKYQTLPYNTKFAVDYNSSVPHIQSKFSNSSIIRKPGEGNENTCNDNIETSQNHIAHSVPIQNNSNKAVITSVASQNQSKQLPPPPPLPPPSSASSTSSSSSVNLAPRVYNLSGPMASSLLTRGQPVGGASSTTSSTTSLATTSSSAGSSTNSNQQKPMSSVAPTSIQQLTSPIYQTSSTKVHPVQPQTLSSTPQGILKDLKLESPQNTSTPNSISELAHIKPALPPKPALPGKPTPPPPPRQSVLWATLQENSENQRLQSEQTLNEPSRLTQLELLDITNNRFSEKRSKPVVDISSEAVDTALNVLRGSASFSNRDGPAPDNNSFKSKIDENANTSPPPPPMPSTDVPSDALKNDKQIGKSWSSGTKKQSNDQNCLKNEKNTDSGSDSSSETMNIHVSLNRRIEMPPAFFFPENATPPADLVASSNQEPYDQVDHCIPKQQKNCDEIINNKLHNDIKENGSAGSDISQETLSSSEISNEKQEESKVTMRIKKGNLKGGNGHSNGLKRRVSFDPLALLLDASLEGELELVMKTAGQVKDPSAANDEGITALHNAICAGHIDIVRFLVQFGCDVNAQDSDGWTPLHCAASCNNVAMVRFLVEHGACIFAQTLSDHETAAEKCEEDEEGFDGCSEFLYSVQEKLGILNNGAVYAVFDYEAHNADELSFREGDRLIVLRKGDEWEKEWWWSRHNDREGYIPRNLLGLYPRVRPSKAAE